MSCHHALRAIKEDFTSLGGSWVDTDIPRMDSQGTPKLSGRLDTNLCELGEPVAHQQVDGSHFKGSAADLRGRNSDKNGTLVTCDAQNALKMWKTTETFMACVHCLGSSHTFFLHLA